MLHQGTGAIVNVTAKAASVLPNIIDTKATRILFLASDEGKVVHGASIPIYGSF